MPFKAEVVVRRERPVVIYTDVTCNKCGKPPPKQSFPRPKETLQLDNVLLLEIHGGYGMFTDPMNYPRNGYDPESTILLCHECAHELADWLGLDVHNWHTHVPAEFGGTQHTDHHDE